MRKYRIEGLPGVNFRVWERISRRGAAFRIRYRQETGKTDPCICAAIRWLTSYLDTDKRPPAGEALREARFQKPRPRRPSVFGIEMYARGQFTHMHSSSVISPNA